MKANSLEELVTNSNIAGELRNYTDWHTRLVKFAQLVADWQKEQMMKEAVEGEVRDTVDSYFNGEYLSTIATDRNKFKSQIGDKVRILVLKAEEE